MALVEDIAGSVGLRNRMKTAVDWVGTVGDSSQWVADNIVAFAGLDWVQDKWNLGLSLDLGVLVGVDLGALLNIITDEDILGWTQQRIFNPFGLSCVTNSYSMVNNGNTRSVF